MCQEEKPDREEYSKVIKFELRTPDAWYGYALSQAEQGETNKAIAALNQALSLDPKNAEFWLNRGWILMRDNREEAIENFEKAIAINPDYADAYFLRASALRDMGKYGQSIENFKTFVKLCNDWSPAWYGLGDAQRLDGKDEEAVDSYGEAIRLNSRLENAWYGRGLARANKGNYKGAIEDFEEVLKRKPELDYVWFDYGRALRCAGRFRDAISSLGKAISQRRGREDSAYPDAQYEKAKCFFDLGELDAGIKCLESAAKSDPAYRQRAIGDAFFVPYSRDSRFMEFTQRELTNGGEESESIARQPEPKIVFVSYSHEDRKWLDELKTHLKAFVWEKRLRLWDATELPPGEEWAAKINEAISSAKAAVLLVSRHLFASKFISEEELPAIRDAAEKGRLRIVWFALSWSVVAQTWIIEYQAAVPPDEPLEELDEPTRQRRWVQICAKIEEALGLAADLSDLAI